MPETSKVLHVRNLGQEITEDDLLELVEPFGAISKLVMLRNKNQALIQMKELDYAVSAMEYFSDIQPNVRGRNVYLQFSSHQELTIDQSSQGRKVADQDSEPNRILLVTVHSMLYPITVEVLHQVFSTLGFVEKIVTFQKSAGFQALIQFQSRQSAIQARNSLQVKYNNDRSRDFTNSSLPNEQRGTPSQPRYGDGLCALQPHGAQDAFAQMRNTAAIAAAFGGCLPPGVSGRNDKCTILVTNLNYDEGDEDKLFNLFSIYGNVVRIKFLHNKPDHALVQMGDGLQAELAIHFLKGTMLFGRRMELNFSKHPDITPGSDTHEYAQCSLNRFNNNAVKNYRYCSAPTRMIHVSSLPQDITEEDIVTHLEDHGIILNSKLFEVNGKKQALVLFENEEQATKALACKNGSTIGRSSIRLSFSQLQSV